MRSKVLFLVLCFLVPLNAIRTNVTFGPLDANLTNPGKFFFPVWNPVPEDYCSNPRYPPVPPIGPIMMDIMQEVFPNGTAAPTNSWQRQLWGFNWTDYLNWNGVYMYPYIVSVKALNINLMYPGAPVYASGANNNNRAMFQTSSPDPSWNISSATIPNIVTSEAYDFGIIIKNGAPTLTSVDQFSATITFSDPSSNATTAILYLVKGSPFITLECTNAQIAFGSLLTAPPPPIIAVNNQPPNSQVQSNSFVMQVAQGPLHAEAQWWHVYTETAVTVVFPTSPTNPPYFNAPYSGLLQIAVGEIDDAMGTLLNKYSGVYAKTADIQYDIDDDNNTAMVRYVWQKVNSSNAAQSDLLMLALPHHSEIFVPASQQTLPTQTNWWCIKGPMYAIVGDTWNLQYPLVTAGFGDDAAVDSRMVPDLTSQVIADYEALAGICPGDGDVPGVSGYQLLDLYSYLRDLAMYTDVAIAARALGQDSIAQTLMNQALTCLLPVLAMQPQAPYPCDPPINGTLTCLRSTVDLYYDYKWGGIVNGWYNRFAFDYCQGCDNPQGYYPFTNYGNPFYNDHHFQYGYLVRTLAYGIYLSNQGFTFSITPAQLTNLTKQALIIAREYANPNATLDKAFTMARHKDFYDGHSWAEGYDYSGRVNMWINQQSGGEAVNSYYAVYLLGLALNDTNVRDWGRILLATEMTSVRRYQHLSNRTAVLAQEPYSIENNYLKCLPILDGNANTGATYFGPNSQFECGIVTLPFTPIMYDFINSDWAGEAYDWLQYHINTGGVCSYPNPINDSVNVCPGINGGSWWGNEFECCPWDDGAGHLFPWQQWTAYPNWYPFMYLIQGVNDTVAAWKNLTPDDTVYDPTPSLPFPYLNTEGIIVGYPPGLTRTTALFLLAIHPNASLF